MQRLSFEQKKIAALLLSSPKTAEELAKQSGVAPALLNDALKDMVKLKVLVLEGYPARYKLAEHIIEGVKRRKEIGEKDPFEIRIKAIIQFNAVEGSFLEKNMADIEKKLRKERHFTVYDVFVAKPTKETGRYTSYLEVNLSAKDFASLVYFMYFYGPTSVEVIKPQKVVIAMDDLQDALLDMAEMIQTYNQAMLKYMAKEELNEFAKSLYAPKEPED